jgi:CHASE3 domain sensor protein
MRTDELTSTPERPIGEAAPTSHRRGGWFADRSIGQKLSLGFGSLVALTVVLVGVGLVVGVRTTSTIDRTTELQAPTSLAASRAQAGLLQMIGDVRGYLAFGDASYRHDYTTAQGAFEADLSELQRLATAADQLDPAVIGLTERLAALADAYEVWRPLPDRLYAVHDDQLAREPALRLLIEDATPRVQKVLVAMSEIDRTQRGLATTRAEVALLGDMADFQNSFVSMVAGLRGYVTTGRDIFKFEYASNKTINDTAWRRLIAARERLTPDQQAHLDEIAPQRERFLDLPAGMFEIVEGPEARADLAAFRVEALPLSDQMLAVLAALAVDEQDLLQEGLGQSRADLSSTLTQTLVGGLIAVLLAILLAVFFRRAIAGPIVRLTRVSETIAEGDLSARATPESGDEIGQLAATFNTMTGRLETTVGELNQRNRDQAEYIEEVGYVTGAAQAVEADAFEPEALDGVAARGDALGQLARTFQRMAREVRAREERLRAQVQELRIEIDEARQAKKVAEITDTDFFKDLRGRAAELRRIVDEPGGERGAESHDEPG